MKRLAILLGLLLLPCAAFAQPAPEMVLLPRALAEAANAAHPPARDDCPAVTAALRAQRDAVAEARKTTKPEPVPATP
jgi:hypothetical protein